MPTLPAADQQIVQTHAALICNVVMACQNRDLRPALDEALKVSEANGWGRLVAAIRKILGGSRDHTVLAGLDHEDRTIVEAILRGLQDPSSMPDPNASADPAMAGPGLAHMVYAAQRGNPDALQILADMAEQMVRVGGDMGRLGGIMRRLIDGERDPDILCKGMGPQAEALVLSILDELARLAEH